MIVLLDYNVVSVTFFTLLTKANKLTNMQKKSEDTTGKNFQEAMLLGCFKHVYIRRILQTESFINSSATFSLTFRFTRKPCEPTTGRFGEL